jgi:hypothetical protein
MFKRGCVVLLVISASACSGSRTTAPTPSAAPVSPASPSTAVLAVARFTVVGTVNNSGTGTYFSCVVPSLVLTETGGTSGALVTGLQFHLNTANPANGYLGGGFPLHKRVDAGATSEIVDPPGVYGDFQYDFGGSHDFTSVSVVVSYVDDAGRSGSLTAVAPVSQP